MRPFRPHQPRFRADEDTAPITAAKKDAPGPGPSPDKGSTGADAEPKSGRVRNKVGGAAKATGRLGTYTFKQARRATHADGAGASGLSRLIEMHAFNTAGDAAVAIGLAGTLFFQVPTGEARGQVALFLALTMLPFAIVAPLIGPFLDRFSHGRRWAIGATMALRALLCLALATAVLTESVWLFPCALGVLVSSKAYGVTRAAAVPRLKPAALTLVRANGRVSLSGVVAVTVSAPLAGGAALLGAEWALRYGFVLFAVATVLAILLPEKVDASDGELPLSMLSGASTAKGRSRILAMPPPVSFALRANCGPRFMTGFLTMFMAFLLRENPIGDWGPALLIGMVVAAAGIGNTVGIALGSGLKRVTPAVVVVVALVADAAMALFAALTYNLISVLLLGLTAGVAQSLAKLSLDSTIQEHVPTRVHASAFARSDTTLQLAWVIGGFVGITMPLLPRLGLGVAFGVLLVWGLLILAARIRKRQLEQGAASSAPTH